MSTPLLDRSQTEIRIRVTTTGDQLRDARRRLRRWGADLWTTRHELMVRARRPLRKQPFDILIGCLSVLLPLLLLAPFASLLPITAPSLVLLVAVALATYVGDRIGGVTSLSLTVLAIDLFWVGDERRLDLPGNSDEAIALVVVALCGGALVWLIRETKTRSWQDRQEALAARAVATALNSIEASAAAHASGTAGGREDLYVSLLKAMVGANRAHVGAFLISGDDGATFEVAAAYGLGEEAPGVEDVAPAFVRLIAEERRARVSTNVDGDDRFGDGAFLEVGVRSALGAPMISADDRLIGVVVTGVLARHQFTTTETNRLAALAEKGASILEAVVGYDEREQALQVEVERRQWFENVILAIPEAVVLASSEDGLISAENDAAKHLLGSLVGQDLNTISGRLSSVDDEPLPPESLPLSLAASGGEAASGVEFVVERPDGARIPVLLSVAPVRGHDGGPVHEVVAVFREISALKEASRLKDEFVSVVSHELRSPLTPIRGFVQLVARDLSKEGGHESQVERLESVASHVDRMTRLVDDLLDVSRLKAGLLELRRQATDLREVCREVVNDRRAGGASHKLVLTGGDAPVVGEWDADRIYQVIDNLVGNAIKYSPAKAQVTIAVGRDAADESGWVEVSDQGPGIATEDRDRVFSAFFRTQNAAKSQIAGLGLGLYICHELIAAHDGTIDVGPAPSGGAAVRVRLPAA